MGQTGRRMASEFEYRQLKGLMDKEIARRYRITEHVQGVFYRASALKEAQRLTLYGWIRNLADGSVEAYACGAADSIRQFERWLAQGLRFAKVEKFEAHEALVEDHDDFEVRSD